MSVNELKKVLVGKIAETNDEELLKMIYRMLDSANGVYQMSKEEIMAVEEAQADYRKGNVITHDDLMKELDKWLKD